MFIISNYFKRFFVNLNGLFDDKVVSLTKKEHGSTEHFLQNQIFLQNVQDQYLTNDL